MSDRGKEGEVETERGWRESGKEKDWTERCARREKRREVRGDKRYCRKEGS